jgi:hypothetical protein
MRFVTTPLKADLITKHALQEQNRKELSRYPELVVRWALLGILLLGLALLFGQAQSRVWLIVTIPLLIGSMFATFVAFMLWRSR